MSPRRLQRTSHCSCSLGSPRKEHVMKYRSFLLAVLIAGSVAACNERTTQATSTESAPVTVDRNGCDEDNGGITLPNGFCASVFADNLGHPRHLAVTADG